MRKVNAQEIKRLHRFTRAHFVEYYDLQTELVDHLATGIEKNWESEPELDFEENLQREFKKFGVFGFSDIVAEKTKQMEKRYWKLIGIHVKDFILQPKILFPFMAAIGLVTLFLQKFDYAVPVIFVLLIVQIIYLYRKNRAIRKKLEKQQKVYLLESFIVKGGALFASLIIPSLFSNLVNNLGSISSIGISLILSLLICLIMVFNWVILKVLPAKKEALLNELHPERKFG